MIKKKKLLGLIICFCVLLHPGFAQEDGTTSTVVVQDFELWSSLGLKYKVNKQFSITLDEQLRLENNSSEVDQFFTDLGLNYQIHKRFSLGGNYRFISNNDPDGYEKRSRFSFDATFNHKVSRLRLSYRIRLQTRNDNGISAADGDYPINKIRFRLKGEYNIKKWKLDPFVSGEFFRTSEKYTVTSFDNFRFTVGTSYKLKNFGRVGMFYRMDRELGVSYPQTTNILGVSLRYHLKFKKPSAE